MNTADASTVIHPFLLQIADCVISVVLFVVGVTQSRLKRLQFIQVVFMPLGIRFTLDSFITTHVTDYLMVFPY